MVSGTRTQLGWHPFRGSQPIVMGHSGRPRHEGGVQQLPGKGSQPPIQRVVPQMRIGLLPRRPLVPLRHSKHILEALQRGRRCGSRRRWRGIVCGLGCRPPLPPMQAWSPGSHLGSVAQEHQTKRQRPSSRGGAAHPL